MNKSSAMPFIFCGSLLLGSLVFAQTYGPTPILTPVASPTSSPSPGSLTLQVKTAGPVSYLTDGQGRSIYLFEADTPGQGVSSCTDQCASVWTPITVQTGQLPNVGTGVNASLLGTITRPDGSTQVTYNGWPLYYYTPDQNPGDTTGEGITSFGAIWYLVTPDGSELQSLTGTSASPSPSVSPAASSSPGSAAGTTGTTGTGTNTGTYNSGSGNYYY